jgi:putative transposase
MVAEPADCPWSSYRANALGEPSAILTPHPLYLALAADSGERQEAYRASFAPHWRTRRSPTCDQDQRP